MNDVSIDQNFWSRAAAQEEKEETDNEVCHGEHACWKIAKAYGFIY